MKRFICLFHLIALLCFITEGGWAKSISINVEKPKVLSDYISTSDASSIDELVLSGQINGTDLNFIKQHFTQLRCLDLRGVGLVGGGDTYATYTEGSDNYKWQTSNSNYAEITIYGAYDSVEGTIYINNLDHFFSNDMSIEEVYYPNIVSLFCDYPYKCKENGYGLSTWYYYLNYGENNSVKKIHLPATLATVGHCTSFGTFSALEELTINENNTLYDTRENCNAIIESASDRLISATNVTKLPSTLKVIGEYSFFDTQTAYLEIPSNVEYIEPRGFIGSALSTITFANNSKLRILDKSTFRDCENIVYLELPEGLESVGDSCFA